MTESASEKGLLLLFTGHRIDAPDRPRPRFPASAEGGARALIKEAITRELTRMPAQRDKRSVRGISSGANGGDILFLEVCAELDIPAEMYLAKDENAFIEASVAGPDESWIRRFRTLTESIPVHVLPDDSTSELNVWQRTNQWMLDIALGDPNCRTALIALWDGDRGDGAGGTKDMADRARAADAAFVHLDTRPLAREA